MKRYGIHIRYKRSPQIIDGMIVEEFESLETAKTNLEKVKRKIEVKIWDNLKREWIK